MKELDGEEAEKQHLLFDVKAAANYMEITPLLEVICLWVMFKIEKAKTKDEVSLMMRFRFSCILILLRLIE